MPAVAADAVVDAEVGNVANCNTDGENGILVKSPSSPRHPVRDPSMVYLLRNPDDHHGSTTRISVSAAGVVVPVA